ncbi:MAG: glycosyltransferase family 1 protein [bacterium]|nr:glycosyltransferase family 1 protein [bacterium]
MIHIGIDARLYGTASGTGIGRYVEELIRALAALDREHRFTVFLRRDTYDTFVPPNARWSKVLADFRPYSLAAQTRFPGVIRRAQVDCMHFTHFDHPITYRAPFLVTIHDLILLHHPSIRTSTLGPIRFWTKFAAYRHVLAHATHRSWRIMTPSHTVKREVAARFGVLPEKIVPTLLGIDHGTPTHSDEPSATHDLPLAPFILYIGNAYPHKNVEQLIRVLPEVRKRVPDMRLVLVGRTDDFSKRLQRTAHHSQLPPDAIVFFGQATEAERTQLLRSASAYVSASLDEGFDMPTVEALAVDTPVIASDIPIHHEVLGTHATFVAKNDDRTLINALCTTATSAAQRDTLEGVQHAQQYTWRACALQTLAVYREIGALSAHRNGNETHDNETTRASQTRGAGRGA